MYAFRLEQMGNVDAESTVAPLPATLRKIRASGEDPTWSGFLRADLDRVLTSKDDGRITFRQVGKEFELRVLLEAAVLLPERQCLFEHWQTS